MIGGGENTGSCRFCLLNLQHAEEKSTAESSFSLSFSCCNVVLQSSMVTQGYEVIFYVGYAVFSERGKMNVA
jgi:hypothetical protein